MNAPTEPSGPRATAVRVVRRALGQGEVVELRQKVHELEVQLEEIRGQHLRLAEIADVVQELLVPLASRDQDRIDAALERFSTSL